MSSPYPEDYPVMTKYKGINIYSNVPNRYPYRYDVQPYNSLYSQDARITPKPFPYTNRPWTESQVWVQPQYYTSLLDDRNLRQSRSFYCSDKFLV